MEYAPDGMSDDAFVSAFESCELPSVAFRHREHVRLTFIYLRRHGFEGARRRIREGICRYALHNGAPQKYHETITLAWLRIVQEASVSVEEDAEFEELIAAFPHLLSKSTLREYYSGAQLDSETARAVFVEPDRKPLPEVGPRRLVNEKQP